MVQRATRFDEFEHAIWREMQRSEVISRPLLIAVSGGCDSMVLAYVLIRLRALHKCSIGVAHVHHGFHSEPRVLKFRNRAQLHVKEFAKSQGLKFFTNRVRAELPLRARSYSNSSRIVNTQSEADLREKRFLLLKKWRSRLKSDLARPSKIVLGHHRDDLFETRFIRLIRGVGPQGLQSMVISDDLCFRPFLKIDRALVRDYGMRHKLKWVEDPTNSKDQYLRNWMRTKWLPQLERFRPGSLASLARSLDLLSANSTKDEGGSFFRVQSVNTRSQNPEFMFSRQDWYASDLSQKKANIARLLMDLQIKNYTAGQIEEICKRLDNRRGEFKFTILRHEWRVNAQRVLVLKP